MKRTLIAIVLAIFCTQSKSMSFIDRPAEELYGDSLVVAKGILTKISGKCKNKISCSSYKMEMETQEIFKDLKTINRNSALSFCSPFPLRLGTEYYLFLHGKDKYDQCDLVLPHDGAFQEKAETYFRVNSPESVHWISYEGRSYESSAIIEPDFKDFIKRMTGQPQ